jgi:hypothetical protein
VQEECSDLEVEAGEAGDRHYRAMTEWATRGRGERLREKARALAGQYRRALKWMIDCYARARDSVRSRRKLELAVEYKELVEQDIEILDSN